MVGDGSERGWERANIDDPILARFNLKYREKSLDFHHNLP